MSVFANQLFHERVGQEQRQQGAIHATQPRPPEAVAEIHGNPGGLLANPDAARQQAFLIGPIPHLPRVQALSRPCATSALATVGIMGKGGGHSVPPTDRIMPNTAGSRVSVSRSMGAGFRSASCTVRPPPPRSA